MPTLSGRELKSVRTISLEPNLEALKRRMMSCRVAATTKYSCFNLSSLPSKNYKKTGTEGFRQVSKNHATMAALKGIVDPEIFFNIHFFNIKYPFSDELLI